jgi:hypothetical protein
MPMSDVPNLQTSSKGIKGRRMVAKPKPRKRRWPYVLERDFQATLIAYAQLAGWTIYHTYDSRRSEAGFPDLTMVRGVRLIFAELKSHKGNLTPEQASWLQQLSGVPSVEAYVWRPLDWPEIERVLRGGMVL